MTKAQYSLLEEFGMGLAEVRIAELQRAVMAAVSVALEHALRELSAIGFAASDAGCAQELIVRAALNLEEDQNAS